MHMRRKVTALFKRKLFIKVLVILSIIFLVYQFIIFLELSNINKNAAVKSVPKVHGTHILQNSFFKSDSNGKFTCITSMEKIDFDEINDDYCDCVDGTDEPGTSACSNGIFYCTLQIKKNNFPNLISSSKVNDGICDCCDGSDEIHHTRLSFQLKDEIQQSLKHHQSPCPNLCA